MHVWSSRTRETRFGCFCRCSLGSSGPEAYRQTGAPSGSVVAAGVTGVTAPAQIAQLLEVVSFLIATVHPPYVPVPTVGSAYSQLPVVAHDETVPAATA